MKQSQNPKPTGRLTAAIGAAPRANLIQSEMNRWKAKQRQTRPILCRHRSGGRFLL